VTGTGGSQARPAPPRLAHSSGGRSRTAAAAFCLLVCLTVAALAAVGAELALAYRTPVAAHTDWEAEANVALVSRFYAEVWTGGRLTNLADYVADDHAYHDPSNMALSGPKGVAEVVAGLRAAFPDLALTLDDVAAQGDRVVVRFTARGTHRGTFLGAEGTGRAVEMTGIAVHRIAYRQIAETWASWDTFGMAQQVGLFLVPATALGGGDGWEGAPSPDQHGKPY
jgi:steroid delta-isomerase-like uncharacterized protein